MACASSSTASRASTPSSRVARAGTATSAETACRSRFLRAPSSASAIVATRDCARYVKLLGARWWLLAAGLVAGAVIGYLVSLGGNQVYQATATVYLGQPYSPQGTGLIQDQQTNPSAVGQVVNNTATIGAVA